MAYTSITGRHSEIVTTDTFDEISPPPAPSPLRKLTCTVFLAFIAFTLFIEWVFLSLQTNLLIILLLFLLTVLLFLLLFLCAYLVSTSTTTPHSRIKITHAFDGIAPPCPSASTSATSFDVFINHRGPDVKHTLAGAMYYALHVMGLRVFLDSEELRLGDFLPEAIQEAMCSASLHVAIFSPRYAELPWCLAELSFMLKTGTPIVPVFYHVQPTDLRWVAQGKGMYAKAFFTHQENDRYSSEKVEEWKMALHKVSFYMGESINNNDEEQMALKTIANHVLKVMQIVPVKVAKHPVSVEEVVADFEMIAHESAESQSNV